MARIDLAIEHPQGPASSTEPGWSPPWQERVKHHLVGTPLGRLLNRARDWRRPKNEDLVPLWNEAIAIPRVLRRLIRRDSNCVDVGGHLGLMLDAMTTLAPEGRHVVFEPVPYKARWLSSKFPRAAVFNCAVGDEAGPVTFYQYQRHSALSGLRVRAGMSHEARAVTIPCERLDDRLRHWPRIDFVKIDVEGAELLVLKGGREVLTKWRPRLLLECTVEGTKRFGYGPSDVYDLLTAELGYRVFLVADWLWSSGPIDRALFCGASAYPPLARNFLAERVDG